MVLTKETELPSFEELTVPEINLSTPFLKAASLFLGKQCEDVNNEYMLCKKEENDPRKCIDAGKAVTACSMKFFQMIKKNCADELTDYATCLDKSSYDMAFYHCRNTQAVFDSCMLTKLGLERPHYGYACEAKVHRTKRVKPCPEPPPVYPDATPELPSEDLPRPPARHGARSFM